MIRSPEFIKRSLAGSGVKVASVDSTGLTGACGTPFLVIKAKLTGSTPATLRQAALLDCPVTAFCERLSMLKAAHHLVASQLGPKGFFAQPGGLNCISVKATPG